MPTAKLEFLYEERDFLDDAAQGAGIEIEDRIRVGQDMKIEVKYKAPQELMKFGRYVEYFKTTDGPKK
ncbi:MAG: hypothetical protein MI867_10640 [Pseudomonadales bacterium]|nr:hypothetical protein [Pseudomonadales bacterium]